MESFTLFAGGCAESTLASTWWLCSLLGMTHNTHIHRWLESGRLLAVSLDVPYMAICGTQRHAIMATNVFVGAGGEFNVVNRIMSNIPVI